MTEFREWNGKFVRYGEYGLVEVERTRESGDTSTDHLLTSPRKVPFLSFPVRDHSYLSPAWSNLRIFLSSLILHRTVRVSGKYTPKGPPDTPGVSVQDPKWIETSVGS